MKENILYTLSYFNWVCLFWKVKGQNTLEFFYLILVNTNVLDSLFCMNSLSHITLK